MSQRISWGRGLLLVSILLCLSRTTTGRQRTRRNRRITHVKEGAIRLVGGQTSAGGNVEIFHMGLWGTVCDDEWDDREANLVCRTLGFTKAVRATLHSEFGKGRRVIWMDNLYCVGHEKRLEDCKFDGWGVHDCTTSESAGVVCENGNKTTSNTTLNSTKRKTELQAFPESFIQLRLMGGRTTYEGRVEIKMENSSEWGLVCGDGWSLFEANVVCQQLGLGYSQSAIQSSFFGGKSEDIVISGIKCSGRETNISDCLHHMTGRVFCPGQTENIAAVMCVTELPDLAPNAAEIETSAYLEDSALLNLLCAREENCLASAANKVDESQDGWYYEKRRLLRFTAKIENVGTTDFRPFIPKAEWSWHMCHRHYHSMEVFAHFDIIDLQGQKVAEGHKASFCLEDNECAPGVEKKYACANYGDQGISVGCTDTYLHNVDCQWVDITDLSPGVYTFKVAINPEFKVAELNYDNNAAVCTLFYNAVSARLFNCSLTRP